MPDKTFNFKAYNLLLEQNCGIGLKLHLAIQMLKDVDRGFQYFNNELQPTLNKLVTNLVTLQRDNKQLAKDVALRKQQEKERTIQERQGPASEETVSDTTTFKDYPVDTIDTVSKID